MGYATIDLRIWRDETFQSLWNARWSIPSRVPKQRPYPRVPLPALEQLCRERRTRFRKEAASLLAAAIARLGRRCNGCHLAAEVLVPDHVIPITWGGTNDPANIQPLCLRCNAAKGGRLPDAPNA